MSNVFELEASVGLDTSKFKQGIKEAIEQAEKLRKELNKTGDEANDLGKEIDKEGEESKDAADETKKLGNEIKTTGERSEKTTSKIKELAGSLKDGLVAGAKVAASAVGAASVGIGKVVKDSVSNYSEYEQLAGGIKKIYGDVADDVIKNAENSLASSATNVNEYLSGVTGFSQTLIQALGRGAQTDIDELQETLDAEYTMTKQTLEDEYDDVKSYWNDRIKESKAAKDGEAELLTKQRDEELKELKRSNEAQLKELKARNKEAVAEAERANQQTGEITEDTYKKAADYADMIMRDIADNASTFGKYTAQELTTVYNALSRGSYMTLDNLNLGYKGTKEEMERLIADANDYAESIGETGDMTIDSFADIVRAIDLIQRKIGISKTAANEAKSTITGSIKGVKDAWTNLTIEMSKENGDIKNSFQTLFDNVSAMSSNMLPKIGNALDGVGELVKEAAPKISEAISTKLPQIVPQLLTTAGSLVGSISKGLLEAMPALLDAGKDILGTIAESIENANFNSEDSIIGKLLDSISENSPAYLEYAERIVSGIGNAIINLDHSKLGETIGTFVKDALNSINDLLADLDMNKVGQNIAEFMNAIPWKEIATSLINLLGSAIGSLGDIAAGFFKNADLDTLITAIGVLGGKSLIGGIGQFFSGGEGSLLTNSIGQSWASTFMLGIKAFGLGWAIGSYLRDNIEFGGKTLGEWVDTGMEKFFGDIPETDDDFNTDLNTGYINVNGKLYTIDPTQNPDMYKKYNPQAYARWYENYGSIAKKAGFDVPTPFAEGGRVTRPTFAIVGEKEPETIIPDSKRGEFGNTTNYITINVEGYSIKNDEEFTELLSRKLSELSVRQQRALGGAGW